MKKYHFLTLRIGSWVYKVYAHDSGLVTIETERNGIEHFEKPFQLCMGTFFDCWLPRMLCLQSGNRIYQDI